MVLRNEGQLRRDNAVERVAAIARASPAAWLVPLWGGGFVRA